MYSWLEKVWRFELCPPPFLQFSFSIKKVNESLRLININQRGLDFVELIIVILGAFKNKI